MLWRRSAQFAAKADEYEFVSTIEGWNLRVIDHDKRGRRLTLTPREEAGRAAQERVMRHAERLHHKYRRAALRPWLPIDPDPEPPPGWGGP